jgi:hypothetical protein
MLAPDDLHIQALRDKHGREFEDWWRQTFGFGFDCLTRSEARYLENSPDAQTIRDRLTAAGLESGAGPTVRANTLLSVLKAEARAFLQRPTAA